MVQYDLSNVVAGMRPSLVISGQLRLLTRTRWVGAVTRQPLYRRRRSAHRREKAALRGRQTASRSQTGNPFGPLTPADGLTVRDDGRPAGSGRPGSHAGRVPHRAHPTALPTGDVPMSRQLDRQRWERDFHGATHVLDWHRAERAAGHRRRRGVPELRSVPYLWSAPIAVPPGRCNYGRLSGRSTSGERWTRYVDAVLPSCDMCRCSNALPSSGSISLTDIVSFAATRERLRTPHEINQRPPRSCTDPFEFETPYSGGGIYSLIRRASVPTKYRIR